MIKDFQTDVKDKEKIKQAAQQEKKEKKPKKKDVKKDKEKKKEEKDISSMSENSLYTPEQRAKWKERGKQFAQMSLYDHQHELYQWEKVFDELESKIDEGNQIIAVE